ncbi:hypothetical protein LguiB_027345 [Lonicera macranthoides]
MLSKERCKVENVAAEKSGIDSITYWSKSSVSCKPKSSKLQETRGFPVSPGETPTHKIPLTTTLSKKRGAEAAQAKTKASATQSNVVVATRTKRRRRRRTTKNNQAPQRMDIRSSLVFLAKHNSLSQDLMTKLQSEVPFLNKPPNGRPLLFPSISN